MSDAVELPRATDPPHRSNDAPSLWRLLCTTPLSDVLRGRLTGRLNTARRTAAIDLPAPLAALALDVVRRTRLWQTERAEIARELVAHFSDGLAAGRTPQQLAQDFGDPRQAAKLLRRAAKRNRPWPWRAMGFALRATVFGFLGLALVYAAVAIRFYLGKAGPITDYRPEINAPALAVKESDKAWPLYREALKRLPKKSPDAIIGEGHLNRMPAPGEEGWDAVEAYLQEAAPALQFARHAAEKPGLGLVVGYAFSPEDQELWPQAHYDPQQEINSPNGGGMFGLLLPHLGSLRTLAMALGYDAQRAASKNDGSTFVADLRGMAAIARDVRETPLVINDLVGASVVAKMCDAIEDALANHPQAFGDADLTVLAHTLAAFDDRALAVEFRGERAGFKDVLQRVYTDDGHGDGRVTPQGIRWLRQLASLVLPHPQDDYAALMRIADPAIAAAMAGRRAAADQYDRLMSQMEAEAATPLWERDESRAERQLQEWMASPLQRLRHFPLCELLPALSKATLNTELTCMRRDAAITTIALEIYRRKHNAWPASLNDLVPSIMPALPIDRFDGQPLRYRLLDGKPLLYSVGTDREDDGGVANAAADASLRQWRSQQWMSKAQLEERRAQGALLQGDKSAVIPDGDWILWPPLPQPPLHADSP